MASFKRRRAINVDVAYIDKLKHRASNNEGHRSATALASMILTGMAVPLGFVHSKGGKAKGVSMTEAIWLSVRKRADAIGESACATIQLMLEGGQAPLTNEEISFGSARAKEREEKRAAGTPEEEAPAPRLKPKPKPKAKAKAPKPAPEPAKVPKPEPEDVVKQMRDEETEEQKRRRMKLSKGHPLNEGEESSRRPTKPDPEDDSHGGVFLF